MKRTTVVGRVTLSALAVAGLMALGATPAAAHVTITPSTTAAGARAVLRVEIPHGCEGSATTALTLRIPEEVTDVAASATGRWAVEQGADSLTWTTGEPLPDGAHDEVELTLRLPDDVGATLVFPVVQRCEEGEVAWTEVAEHGEGHDSLDRPAPVLVVTSADGDGDGDGDGAAAGATAGADEADEAADVDKAADVDERDPLVTYGAAGLLVAGVLVGGAVLLRRRGPRP